MKLWTQAQTSLQQLVSQYGLDVQLVPDSQPVPGSYWGGSEAGLMGNRIYLRRDTPLHSALHEACHYICMDQQRREALDTDAGGTDVEENGVCYLQLLLAELIPNYSRITMFQEMDEWGYSFRLGSAKTWFEQDAEDAQEFLKRHKLIANGDLVCIGQLRCS